MNHPDKNLTLALHLRPWSAVATEFNARNRERLRLNTVWKIGKRAERKLRRALSKLESH